MFKGFPFFAYLSATVLSGIDLAMYAYLGSFSRFMADDYCVAYFANRFGLLRSIWYWYRTWSGGFSTSVLDWLLIFIRPKGIPFVTPIVVILWFAITVIAVKLILPRKGKKAVSWAASTALAGTVIFSILLTAPDVPQSLFWWVGMRAYVMPLLFATLFIAAYQYFQTRDWNAKWQIFWYGASFSITFFSGGFSETYTPLQALFLAYILGLGLTANTIKSKSQPFFFLLMGLIGAIASLIVMVAAPGNAIRQSYFPPTPSFYKIINISITGFILFLESTFGSPAKTGGLIGLTLLAIHTGFQTNNGEGPKWWLVPLILFTGLIGSFLSFPPAAFGMSEAPAGRTLIIASYIIVGTLFYAGLVGGKQLSSNTRKRMVSPAVILIFSLLLIGFSALMNVESLYAIRPDYIEYAEKWNSMNSTILNAKSKGSEIVLIPVIRNWAKLDPPNDNPKHWVTKCMSDFYGINIRAVDQDSP